MMAGWVRQRTDASNAANTNLLMHLSSTASMSSPSVSPSGGHGRSDLSMFAKVTRAVRQWLPDLGQTRPSIPARADEDMAMHSPCL